MLRKQNKDKKWFYLDGKHINHFKNLFEADERQLRCFYKKLYKRKMSGHINK